MATIPANNNTSLYNTTGVPATTGNDLTVSGNVNANNFNATSQVNAGTTINAQGNISTGAFFIGNGSQLTGLVSSYGNANVAAFLASGTDSSNIITTGNVAGTYFLGNGSQLTGLPAIYGNANVATLLASFGSNTISTTGNITGGYILGNGSQLTGLPEAYGNANVAAFLASGSDSSNIVTTGNVSGTYILGNGSQLTGLPATYSNANVTTLLANFGSNSISTTGNVSSGNGSITNDLVVGGTIYGTFSGNISGNFVVPGANTQVLFNNSGNAGASADFTFNDATNLLTVAGNVNATQFNGSAVGLTNIPGANVTGTVPLATSAGTVTTAAQPNITSVGTLTSLTASGNISGSYIFGNGSQLTGLPATYSNANVVSLLAAFGSNTISTTGNITGGNIISPTFQAVNSAGSTLKNATGTTQASWGAGGGDNFTIAVSTNITGANAQIAISPTGNSGHVHIKPTGTPSIEIAPTYTGSINNMIIGNITPAAANVTSLNASGNITGSYILGNGSQLTGIVSSYGNANVTTLLANFGSNTIVTTGNISGGNISASGNVTAAYINTTGVSGNITGANYITANYFVGNGSLLTGISGSGNLSGNLTGNIDTGPYYIQRAGGSVLMGNVWVQGTLAANSISSPAGNFVDIEGITTTNGIVSQGNVQAANLISNAGVFTGTLAATSLIANTQIGNLLFLNQQVQTTQAADAGLTSTTPANPGQIFVGTGYNGNTSTAFDINNTTKSARLAISDTYNLSNGNSVARALGVQNFANLTANITGTNFRYGGVTSTIAIGGGSAANTISGALTAIIATSGAVQLGGGTSGNLVSLGNTTAQYAIGVLGIPTISAGSTGGNIYASLMQFINSGTGNTLIGHAFNVQGAGTYANVYGVYNAGNTNNHGYTSANGARNATNYFFLKNEDDHAYNQVGQIKGYQTTQYALASSGGAVSVNKANGQSQLFTVSEAATMSFTNFITSSTVAAVTRYMNDTVNVIVKQDATGRTITMPSGAAFKYASGTSIVPSTANSVSEITIRAYYDTGAAATAYLITISPIFS